MPFKSLSSLAAVIAGFAFVLAAQGADWPQWRGPDRTSHVPAGARVPAKLPAEPKVLWKVPVGESFASPIVLGDTVFHVDNRELKETLHALDAKTGTERWRATIDDCFKDTQGPPAPRCTPLAEGDRVYAQSGKGELQCLSAKDGKLLWRVNYTNDFEAFFIGEIGKAQGATRHGNNGSPVIEGEKLIALVGGTNGAGIVAFHKMTGKVIWKSQNDVAGYAAPIAATLHGVRQVIAFTCEGLVALDVAHGRLLWRVPYKTSYSRHVTTPTIVGDIVVAGSQETGLIGNRISKQGNEFKAEQAWVNKDAAMNFSSPVVVAGHLYGLGAKKTMVCVEGKTGQITWKKEGYFQANPGNSVGYFIGMGDNILAQTDGGLLVLLAADAKEFREIAQVQVCGQTWSGPAYADGKLYVRDGVKTGGSLQCVELLP